MTNETETCGSKRKKLSEIEPSARKIASAFWQNGLRKGDVVHFVIPNNTEYHTTVIGAWLCEAVVSLGKRLADREVCNQLFDKKPKNSNFSNAYYHETSSTTVSKERLHSAQLHMHSAHCTCTLFEKLRFFLGIFLSWSAKPLLDEIVALASQNCQINAVHSIDSTDFS